MCTANLRAETVRAPVGSCVGLRLARHEVHAVLHVCVAHPSAANSPRPAATAVAALLTNAVVLAAMELEVRIGEHFHYLVSGGAGHAAPLVHRAEADRVGCARARESQMTLRGIHAGGPYA
jgi:hypothetical protein